MSRKELLFRIGIFPLGLVTAYLVDKAFGDPFNAKSVSSAITLAIMFNLLFRFNRKGTKTTTTRSEQRS